MPENDTKNEASLPYGRDKVLRIVDAQDKNILTLTEFLESATPNGSEITLEELEKRLKVTKEMVNVVKARDQLAAMADGGPTSGQNLPNFGQTVAERLANLNPNLG